MTKQILTKTNSEPGHDTYKGPRNEVVHVIHSQRRVKCIINAGTNKYIGVSKCSSEDEFSSMYGGEVAYHRARVQTEKQNVSKLALSFNLFAEDVLEDLRNLKKSLKNYNRAVARMKYHQDELHRLGINKKEANWKPATIMDFTKRLKEIFSIG